MDAYTVVPNHQLHCAPAQLVRHQRQLPSNRIKTTRYTPLTFVPLNLFEQFHRFANVYFVFIAILNFVPQVEAINPWAALFPPLFIFLVTMVKDGREYYNRSKLDDKINRQKVRVYQDGCFNYQKWESVKVGDIVELDLNDVIPADILLLASSDPNQVCFVETANLDGETNLKQKCILKVPFDTIDQFTYAIHTQAPNSNLNDFQGQARHLTKQDKAHRTGLKNENIIYGGCVLRNTDTIAGLVIYAGMRTKSMLSNSTPQHKVSLLEKLMNRDIILFAALLIIMCCSAAAASVIYQQHDGDVVWYMANQTSRSGDLFIHGFFVFLTMIILLQILIPISLYVSIELVKLVQVAFIEWDANMFDTRHGAVSCRTLNITEDLGSVQHIFSDKTGTLTENSMVFRSFSIDGTIYAHQQQQHHIARATMSPVPLSNAVSSVTLSSYVNDSDSIRSSVRPRSHQRRRQNSQHSQHVPDEALTHGQHTVDSLETRVMPDFACVELIKPLDETSVINDFMLCLITCNSVVIGEQRSQLNQSSKKETPKRGFLKHVKKKLTQRAASPTVNVKDEILTTETVVFEMNDDTTQPPETIYEAESPDEACLVYTAASYGVRLIRRDHQKAIITWPTVDGVEPIKYLAILPFDATRKMMSVIIQINQRTLVLTKGADSSVLERLSSTASDETRAMMKHIEEYSMRGLRTLCIARRELNEVDSEHLISTLQRAEQEISNDGAGIEAAYALIERDLELIGVTAIEDRLQPGVPESVEALRQAGLAMWVLTGDKMETAIEIGRLCRLIQPHDQVVIMSGTAHETHQQLDKLKVDGNVVLAINGANLNYLMHHHLAPFLAFASQCRAVICCRTTPLDKGAIVDQVARHLGVRTLAVGDGANDVAMIRNAHVGCGIAGAEGRQAVMAADYALPRFAQLTRLLLVHGHLSYARLARMIEYFYYKSTVFIFLLFWFQFYNRFSGSAMIPDMYLILFMLIFNSVPGMVNAALDQILPIAQLEQKPELFKNSSQNKMFPRRVFWLTLVDSVWQSVTQFFIPYWACTTIGETYQGTGLESGSSISIYVFGTLVAEISLISQFLHLSIETYTWTWINALSLLVSMLLFYVFGIVTNILPATGQGEFYAICYMLAQPIMWLIAVVTSTISILPRLTIILYYHAINPAEWFHHRRLKMQ